MASSSAHDFFLQEANTISYVHLLMSRAWRHLDVTHVPLVIQVRDLFFIKSQKMIFFTLKQCFSWTSGDARGLGLLFMVCACAIGLGGNVLIGMRGTWGVVWQSAHVPTIPFTQTAQSKSLGPHCACVQPLHHYRGLPMNAYVHYPMGSRGFSWPNIGIVTSNGSPDLNARFWLVDKICAALWLVGT